MPLVITKPITYVSGNFIGAVATYETASTLTNAQNINGYVNTDNATLGHNIGWETSPTDSDWANGTSGAGLITFVISAIGSDTNPTIATLNSHPMITEYLHSSHSNSLNGTGSQSSSIINYSNMTMTISGQDTISFTSYNESYYDGTPAAALRSVDTSSSTWYLNGISTGTSQSGGSSNEDYPTDYWSKTDFQINRNNFKDEVISKISTNQDDIIEFLVKNSLTPEAIKRLYVQLHNDGIIT